MHIRAKKIYVREEVPLRNKRMGSVATLRIQFRRVCREAFQSHASPTIRQCRCFILHNLKHD